MIKNSVRLVIDQPGTSFTGVVPKWIAEMAKGAVETARVTGKPQQFGGIIFKEVSLDSDVRLKLGAIAVIHPYCKIQIIS
jgi:hypothetical protein